MDHFLHLAIIHILRLHQQPYIFPLKHLCVSGKRVTFPLQRLFITVPRQAYQCHGAQGQLERSHIELCKEMCNVLGETERNHRSVMNGETPLAVHVVGVNVVGGHTAVLQVQDRLIRVIIG